MKTIALFFLLCVTGLSDQLPDSLLSLIEKKSDSTKISVLNDISWRYRRNNPHYAILAGESALEIARKNGYKALETRTLNILSIANRALGRNQSALWYATQALRIAEKLNNPTEIAYAENNIGGAYILKAYYTNAYPHIARSLRTFEQLHDTMGMCYALVNIAYIYQGQKNTLKALGYFEQTLELRKKINDTLGALSILDDIAKIKLKNNLVSEAKTMLLNAETEYERRHDYGMQAARLMDLGNLYLETGKIDSAYMFASKAYDIVLKTGHIVNTINFGSALGVILARQGKFAEGEKLLQNAYQLAEKANDYNLLASVCNKFTQYYKINGQPAKSLQYMEKYNEMRDSIAAHDNVSSISEMESMYLDEQIKKDNAILQKDVEFAKTQRTLSTIIAVLFLIAAIALALRNRTEKRARLAEQLIRKSEEKFKNAFEISPDAICITDLQTSKYVAINKSFSRITGFTPDDVIGKTSKELGVWKIDSEHEHWAKVLMERGLVENVQAHFKVKDGSIRTGLLSATIIETNNEKFVFNIVRDVTVLLNAQENVAKLSRAVEQSPVSIIITNLNGTIEYANEKTLTTTGFTIEELLGKKPSIFSSGTMPPEFYANLWRTLLAGNEWSGEFLNKKKNGQLYWEYASISSIKDSDGRIQYFLAIKEDISNRKALEENLRSASKKAESANKLKDAFIANISHEIRTPLNGVIGMSHIIESLYIEKASPEEKQFFKSLDTSCKRLMTTMDKILNFSRLRVGEYPLHFSYFSLSRVINTLITEYGPLASEKNIGLNFQHNAAQDKIVADENSVQSAIGNILDNAIKFSSNNEVVINLYNKKNQIVLEISDKGIGISENYLEHIFEPYTQEETGFSRPYEGVGLGLSISKMLLELNRAQIKVSSMKNEGTTCTLLFEQLAFSPKETEKDDIIETENYPLISSEIKPILLAVEDDKQNQFYYESLLKNQFVVEFADNAAAAEALLAETTFDMILLDISLRDKITGLDLVRKLRQEAKYADIPVIAVTGHVSPQDRDLCIEAGCNDYLAKPFTPTDIRKIINRHLKG